MDTNSSMLESAISLVEQEQSDVSIEVRHFEEFRESVSLTLTEPSTKESPSETTEQLIETYGEIVMKGLDYTEVYGDSIDESLKEEFSPQGANILLSKKPITKRRKRKILREISITIERREEFLEELEEEKMALKSDYEKIAEIESLVDALPRCTPSQRSFEDVIEVWERYNKIINRCEEILYARQQRIRGEKGVQIRDDYHALNEYLYSDLQSSYPVLSVLADTIEQINSKRRYTKPALV
jgi:exonuclease VII small subunit